MKALHYLKVNLNVLHRGLHTSHNTSLAIHAGTHNILYLCVCKDVKPSNILINREGQVKLCDFGIAGELVNSFCQTDIGCKPYLAVSEPTVIFAHADSPSPLSPSLQPERINPMVLGAKYDQRSDVWSYGITLVRPHPLYLYLMHLYLYLMPPAV